MICKREIILLSHVSKQRIQANLLGEASNKNHKYLPLEYKMKMDKLSSPHGHIQDSMKEPTPIMLRLLQSLQLSLSKN